MTGSALHLRWPTLSIRATVVAAIALGVLLPAVVVMGLDMRLSRAAHEPLVQRNRAAVQVLGAAVMTEPAWTLNEPALHAAARQLLDEPSVCAVEVLDLQPAATPMVVEARRCDASVPVVAEEVPVLHEGQAVARLRIAFDGTEIDQLLSERRAIMWWLVPAQVAAGVAVLFAVLSWRLLRPIRRLKAQASALVSREPAPPIEWRQRDELGQLGQHLNEVRGQLLALFDELEGKNAELHMRAMFDDLTGLPNRSLFRELFQHRLASARRDDQPMALLFIDLDRFKQVNDTLGHAAGDELLLALSRRMSATLRESDLVGRLGGDEFLALLTQVDGRDAALATVDRLLAAIGEPLRLPPAGAPAQVSASIGIAMFPADGEDFDSLVQHADVAMFRVKQGGRAGRGFYQADRDGEHLLRIALERELAHAIDHGQLVLHYQPQFDAASGQRIGAEALVRWQHPRRGLVPPDQFIAAAEQGGLIGALGRWTLDAACAQIAAWRDAGLAPGAISVNVSPLQLRDGRLADQVRAALQRHGVVPRELVLELTESALIGAHDGDIDTALERLAPLRALGVGIALDDFGTGYSSLSHLKRLKPDVLKVDRAFVRDLPGDADDLALVQAIVAMAHALGIEVIAEGVETAAQRDCLRAMGCRLHQGWLYGRAAPAAAFAEALTSRAHEATVA